MSHRLTLTLRLSMVLLLSSCNHQPPATEPAMRPATAIATPPQQQLPPPTAIDSSTRLSAEGYGATAEEARRSAQGALSESLKVEVKSLSESLTDSQGLLYAKRVVESSSRLPLLGLQVKTERLGLEYHCTVVLDRAEALHLYQQQIDHLAAAITPLHTAATTTSGEAHYRQLEQIYEKLDQIEDYVTVTLLLGQPKLPALPTTLAAVTHQLQTIESRAPTLAIASRALIRDLPPARYQVQPPLLYGSHQVSQFGRLMRDALTTALPQPTTTFDLATATLEGQYEILAQGISLSYRAIERNGETMASRQVVLDPAAYQGMRYQADQPDYEKLLHEEEGRPQAFRAALTTDWGDDALAFRGGQVVKLRAKLNRSGFFYVVAHNHAARLSYLLELNDAEGEDRFIVSVDTAQVNRWLDLTPEGFTLTPPFGTEDLQLIAATNRPRLPPYRHDRASGYYRLTSPSLSEAVIATRSFKPLQLNPQSATAEAVLTYTSSP